ncbi:hypothetical protein [Streptomyces echinatus]|uniref:hypothetical protein n=1 Tax=Streptomyces echinatus TaxID=67293 RepID=UPI0038240EB1
MADQTRLLGGDHPDTLADLISLVADQTRVLGPDHPDDKQLDKHRNVVERCFNRL